MVQRPVGKLSFGIAALALFLVYGVANSSLVRAQSSVPDWEKAAGGKMSFDVFSVKLDTSGQSVRPNRSLGPEDDNTPTGGLLTADFPVRAYIDFAYKLTLSDQVSLAPQLPKWASQDKFYIQARASTTNPTKDQMRLMMQSLLADRFKLVVHWEKKDMPVYTLAVAPGGFKLKSSDSQSNPASGTSPMVCPAEDPACRRLIGGPMPVADFVGYLGAMVGRPVINKTGLTGTYGMNLMWSSDTAPNSSLPSLPSALRDQFGLKLKSGKAPVDVLIIDHIAEPAPN